VHPCGLRQRRHPGRARQLTYILIAEDDPDIAELVRQVLSLPILFLTALPERALTANAPIGPHEIVAKPFDVDALLAAVDRLMAGTRPEIAA
jgi:DNA-binding response OmpR family regulator